MSIFGTPVFASGGQLASSNTATASAVNTATSDLIGVVFGGANGGAITSVTDTALNSYTVSTALRTNSAGGIYYAYCIGATANAANQVKVTFTGSQPFAWIAVWDIPITGGTPAFDIAGSGQSSGLSGTPATVGYNTAGSDEIVLVAAGNDFSGIGYTEGAGYTLDSGGFVSGVAGAEHIAFASPQTSVVSSFTQSGNTDWVIAALAFQSGGAPPVTSTFSQVIIME